MPSALVQHKMEQLNSTFDYDNLIRTLGKTDRHAATPLDTAVTTAASLVSSVQLFGGPTSSVPTDDSSVLYRNQLQPVPAAASQMYPMLNPVDSDFVVNSSGASVFYAAIENRTIVGGGASVVDDSTDYHWDWAELLLASVLCVLIVITVIGNTLVILSVMTTRRLRTVTNCFVMSLAVADWLVGIFVMPPAVAVHLIGEYALKIVCKILIAN